MAPNLIYVFILPKKQYLEMNHTYEWYHKYLSPLVKRASNTLKHMHF